MTLNDKKCTKSLFKITKDFTLQHETAKIPAVINFYDVLQKKKGKGGKRIKVEKYSLNIFPEMIPLISPVYRNAWRNFDLSGNEMKYSEIFNEIGIAGINAKIYVCLSSSNVYFVS